MVEGLPYVNHVVNISSGGGMVLQGVSKAGVINVGGTLYNIYLNGTRYDNISDFKRASTLDVAGLAVKVAAGTAIASSSAPVIVVFFGSVAVGYLVDVAVDSIKPDLQ